LFEADDIAKALAALGVWANPSSSCGLGQAWAGHPPRILSANRMAREMLDARDGLWLEAGLLSASDMNDGRTLQK
jgi:hypothetical protein